MYRGNHNLSGEYGKSVFVFNDTETLEQRLTKTLENNNSTEFINSICTSLFNVVNILGIDKIVFSGKFDKIFPDIELEMINRFFIMGKPGLSLIQSTYGEFSASVGVAMSCYNWSQMCLLNGIKNILTYLLLHYYAIHLQLVYLRL